VDIKAATNLSSFPINIVSLIWDKPIMSFTTVALAFHLAFLHFPSSKSSQVLGSQKITSS
jgi:hypothetical protein